MEFEQVPGSGRDHEPKEHGKNHYQRTAWPRSSYRWDSVIDNGEDWGIAHFGDPRVLVCFGQADEDLLLELHVAFEAIGFKLEQG